MRGMFLVVATLFLGTNLQAQEVDGGFMVVQMSVCPQENMGTLNATLERLMRPIMNELVEEGMVQSWYALDHGWGDEWNSVMVTVTDSHRAWLDAWSEFLRRANTQEPGWFADMVPLCTMHKDNMYVVRAGHAGTG